MIQKLSSRSTWLITGAVSALLLAVISVVTLSRGRDDGEDRAGIAAAEPPMTGGDMAGMQMSADGSVRLTAGATCSACGHSR